MSKFYGQVSGASSTVATRRGHQNIKVSAQSWDGSLITSLWYNDNDLMVSLDYDENSTSYGRTLFSGPMTNLLKIIELGKQALNEQEI